jgi:hypothetical protein
MNGAGCYIQHMQIHPALRTVSICRTLALALSLGAVLAVADAADATKKKGKAKAAATPAEPAAPPYEAAMARFDKDGNGLLNRTERDALRTAFATEAPLKPLDSNGDGKLDEGELDRVEDPPKAKGQNKKKAAETK